MLDSTSSVPLSNIWDSNFEQARHGAGPKNRDGGRHGLIALAGSQNLRSDWDAVYEHLFANAHDLRLGVLKKYLESCPVAAHHAWVQPIHDRMQAELAERQQQRDAEAAIRQQEEAQGQEARTRTFWEEYVERLLSRFPISREYFEKFCDQCDLQDLRERVFYQIVDQTGEHLEPLYKFEGRDIYAMHIAIAAADKVGALIEFAEELRRMKPSLPESVEEKLPRIEQTRQQDPIAARQRIAREARRKELRELRHAEQPAKGKTGEQNSGGSKNRK